ncbi:ethylene-responsive transcription factor ERF027-like protein [Tanacetum coccineum]
MANRRCRNSSASQLPDTNNNNPPVTGTYPTPEMETAAYDVAALTLKGTYAKIHFPNSILNNTLPECPTADDIRAATARAAAA